MREVKQSVELLAISNLDEAKILESYASILSVPYSKGTFDMDKTKTVLGNCVRRGHLSVLEHASATLKCVTNIGTYKDYTRHRHCAFTIESTSYTKYNEFSIVSAYPVDKYIILGLEKAYQEAITNHGVKKARDILPQCTAATMIMTTNFREWRWIIGLRGDPADNPLTKELRDKIWTALNWRYPFFFPIDPAPDDPMTIYNEWGTHRPAQLWESRETTAEKLAKEALES
jgi:thymidylate synthase (FAD)